METYLETLFLIDLPSGNFFYEENRENNKVVVNYPLRKRQQMQNEANRRNAYKQLRSNE